MSHHSCESCSNENPNSSRTLHITRSPLRDMRSCGPSSHYYIHVLSLRMMIFCLALGVRRSSRVSTDVPISRSSSKSLSGPHIPSFSPTGFFLASSPCFRFGQLEPAATGMRVSSGIRSMDHSLVFPLAYAFPGLGVLLKTTSPRCEIIRMMLELFSGQRDIS